MAGGVALATAILVASLLPGPLIETYSAWDKLEHALAYLLLTLWFTGLLERRHYHWAAVGAALLGLAIEWAQGGLTTTRQGDPLDLVANLVGIAVALAASYLALGGWAARVELLLGVSPRR
jgi:VanZ family protein